MDAKLIQFPIAGRGSAATPVGPATAGTQTAPKLLLDPGAPSAVLSIEIRELPRTFSISGEIAGRVLGRCLGAAVASLARLGAGVRLAGTPKHPVIEARFEGARAPAVAAAAALAARAAVRECQRAGERGFAASGGIAEGWVQTADRGVRVAFGAVTATAGRVRDAAAPGQMLLGGARWEDWAGELVADPARALMLGPEGLPMPVRVLRDTRQSGHRG